MMHEVGSMSKASKSESKAFPWRCPECGKKEVRRSTIRYTSEIKHDGRAYTVEVARLRVPKCRVCGELIFDNAADEQIAAALRRHLGLLSVEQIRTNREQLGLSQRDLADHLGVAVETISRWENGVLTQTRAMDRYLRVYFGVPAARTALVNETTAPSLGMHVEI
jgi:putative zinc finger/helix-turn-helix YgiT family protein